MTDIIISLEATCDLPEDIVKEYGFKIIGMNYYVNGKEFFTQTDSVESSQIYEKMKYDAKTSTSQINAVLYEEHFEKLLEENKPVFHIALSSGLSATYKQAFAAADKLNEKYGKKIYVIDSKCGCSGQGILAVLASEYAKNANDVQSVVDYTESIKLNVAHCYTVDNLRYLAKSGRLSSVTAFIGNILKIKPVMGANGAGKLALYKKVLSRQRAIRALAEDFAATYDSSCKLCIIDQALCMEDAETLASLINSATGIVPVITDLGPIVGSHSGPGTLALFYLSKTKRS